MNRKELEEQIRIKQSVLCVGLDSDLKRIPQHLLSEADPVFSFNKAIIDSTHEYAVAYKPNLAFYEAQGLKGWQSLEKTIDYLNSNYPHLFTIADAKRGDIGNTSNLYARAFFEELNFHSITVAPYMGIDSVKPFLQYEDKWVIVLALTSNAGATDFQFLNLHSDLEPKPERLYERVLATAKDWADTGSLMFVVGATKAEYLKKVRAIVPNHFLLIPGVGAQGGSVEEVMKNGYGESSPAMLINASRSIIFSDSSRNFAAAAAGEAQSLQQAMKKHLR